MYEYKGTVTKVIDGDTIDVLIDLGFCVKVHERFRLLNINAPETRGSERELGLKSKQVVTDELLNKEVIIRSSVDDSYIYEDKYGRWLAVVYLDGSDYNKSLVERGLATGYEEYDQYNVINK